MTQSTVLKKKDWSAHARRALSAPEIVAKLVEIPGWVLDGDGADVAIQKTFHFAHYLETMSFVNAVAFIAERHDHHPDMSVHYGRCVVRFNTHDVKGISITDFECAMEIEALVKPR
jgi:4a-hydroxytetrahydrobiopterin dehydratase